MLASIEKKHEQNLFGFAVIPYKLKALSVHLILSSLLLLASYIVIAYVWYPNVHFYINGGWEGIKLMAAVDFVLGPIITLVIFHPNKKFKWLIFDICIVASIQLAALLYGLMNIYNESPKAIALVVDEFRTVKTALLKEHNLNYQKIYTLDPNNTPPMVASFNTEGKHSLSQEQLELFFQKGLLDEYYVNQYQSLIEKKVDIITPDSMQFFLKKHKVVQQQLTSQLQNHGISSTNSVIIIPIRGKYADGLICLDENTLNYITAISLTVDTEYPPYYE